MKRADEIIPWKVTDISLRPYKEMWSMNPSIHFDGQLWRCVLRCTDYAMPAGVTIRSRKAKPGESRTKNVMVIFDASSWKATEIYKMREHDDLPRTPCLCVGYEDVRLFGTDRGGLQGIAASLHLQRSDRTDPSGGFLKQPAEQVLLSFDDEYNIVEARPIRGDAWSGSPQKNWVPFDDCVAPRFLYSIDQATMFDERGAMRAGYARVRPSRHDRRRPHEPDDHAVQKAKKRAAEAEALREQEERRQSKRDRSERRERPLSSAQEPPQTYKGLRGGSQLVRVDADSWLGIGHAMKFVDGLKYYWHVWYLVDSRGELIAASEPMKLAPNGIEFAAGLAVEGERVVVSFGVDDMFCRIGETKLSAVIETLRAIRDGDSSSSPKMT